MHCLFRSASLPPGTPQPQPPLPTKLSQRRSSRKTPAARSSPQMVLPLLWPPSSRHPGSPAVFVSPLSLSTLVSCFLHHHPCMHSSIHPSIHPSISHHITRGSGGRRRRRAATLSEILESQSPSTFTRQWHYTVNLSKICARDGRKKKILESLRPVVSTAETLEMT